MLDENNTRTDLMCTYCGTQAETWDHLEALVRDKTWSGYGHTLGNSWTAGPRRLQAGLERQPQAGSDLVAYERLKEEILELMGKADKIATRLRDRAAEHVASSRPPL